MHRVLILFKISYHLSDRAFTEQYGFSAEELDFIINYDIKFRMGKELESED